MSSTDLIEAVRGLDAGERALLDLSLRQGLEDGEIARLLGTAPEAVADRRSDSLRRLMVATGAPAYHHQHALRRRLRELFLSEGASLVRETPGDSEPQAPRAEPQGAPLASGDEGVRDAGTRGAGDRDAGDRDAGDRDAGATRDPPPRPPPALRTAEPSADRRTGRRRTGRRRTLASVAAIVAVLAIGGVIVAMVLAAGPDVDGGDVSGGDPVTPGNGAPADGAAASGAPGSPPPGRTVEFDRLPGAAEEARGYVRLSDTETRPTLAVRVSGLDEPASRYRVWLYAPSAHEVGRIRSNGTMTTPLRVDPADYRFVAVLLDRKWVDGQERRGVLRAPTAELLR